MSITLVTGSTGFVGSEVCKLLTAARHVVRGETASIHPNSFKIESLNGSTNWVGAFEDVGSVLHLAGLAHNTKFCPNQYESVNVEGTLKLAREAAKAGVKRFIFVSSIGVNGVSTSGVPFKYNSSLNPHNAYAKSKYDAEVGLRKIALDTGLELVIVRPTLVYGVNAPGNFGALTKLITHVPILPFGLTKNKRDFISVQNLADLLLTCIEHPKAPGNTFLACDGMAVSTKEFTNAIANGMGRTIVQFPMPVGLMNLLGKLVGRRAMIDQLYGDLEVDSCNLYDVLGWVAPYSMTESMTSLLKSKL